MFHVVLDTTVLRSDPMRRSSALKSLTRLATYGKIQIHLSDVTRREFVSYREQEFDVAIAEAKKCLTKLREICPGEEGCEKIQQNVEDIEKRRNQVSNHFDKWLAESKVQIHPVDAKHGAAVVDAYFGGAPPFSQIKSRKDFPDAFVFQVIQDLKGKDSPLHVITNDKNLNESIGKLGGVTVYSAVAEFAKAPALSAQVLR